MPNSPTSEKQGMAFVRDVIDPRIEEFSKWFAHPSRGNGGVSGFEREILRSYLWWSMKVEKKDG